MQKDEKSKTKNAARIVAYTGVMTAMVTVATLLGFSTAQFYFNVGDTVILIAAAVLGPIPAMLAGGIGSFFADLAVYPATMFFTLVIKGLEGLIAGSLLRLISKFIAKRAINIALSVAAMAFSAFLMAAGYFVCQTFFYGTYASALIALPLDAVQASVSTVLASVALYVFKLINYREALGINKIAFKEKK